MITYSKTSRNFVLGEFTDLWNHACSIQESSLATSYAIWLGSGDDRLHLDTDKGAALAGMLNLYLEGSFVRLNFLDLYGVDAIFEVNRDKHLLFGARQTPMLLDKEGAQALLVPLMHFIQTGYLPTPDEAA